MKRAAGVTVLLLALASCQQRDHTRAIDTLHRDVVKITQQLADLRVHLAGLSESYDALAKENAALRERVRQLELSASVTSSASTLTPSVPSQPTTPTTGSAPRRGGFTDWGSSSRSSPTPATQIPERAHSSSSPTERSIGNENRPITADQSIVARCAQEWKTDFKMIAYCQKKQQDAKDKLDRGNLYGINGTAFDIIRGNCRNEWGTDYSMRVYCEEKQTAAYKQVNRQ